MITEKIQLNIYNKTVLPFLEEQKNSIFFDIETTGLYWKRSHLYLIGVIYYEENHWILQQWFLDRPTEEPLLLTEFAAICQGRSRVIHYNGNGFDIPYLQHKYNFYQQSNPLASLKSLDLYRKAKPFQNLFGLTSVKQKDVECFLKIRRTDTKTGGDLIQVYEDYLETKDTTLLSVLLQHNRDDTEGLVRLLSVLSYERIREGDFTINSANLSGYTLTLTLVLKVTVPIPVSFHNLCFSLRMTENQGILQIFGYRGTMKHFFPDYKNYYYLPLEDQAIHKSIGIFVDSAHREKAKAANCYQKTQGIFLPQPKERFKPVFYEAYKSKPAYFAYQESLLQDMQSLHIYTCDFLSEL
ncbi:ribonuclease H-like domain-containing protein [Novisyntrophococcus fermenticellae]|uniref:ribonuclease H-like domain-containing protein n=1 Tax=Novisyntrophococcus fermenticellae TaxID=2068655 RepID=UPI001E592D46|nr:ribonuclease H-like domain-containing protein [Novisyntrophococcus fermenticellae]